MMKRLALALCAAVLPLAALPAPADADDDLAAQYRAAHATYLPFGRDPAESRRGIAVQLEAAVGVWVPMSDYTFDDNPELDARLMTPFCNVRSYRLEAPTPYCFTLTHHSTRQGRAVSLTQTFDYITASNFQRRTDDAEIVDFHRPGPEEIQDIAALNLTYELENPWRFGPVTVLWPSPDIMVMLSQTGPAGPATIWLRCP